MSSSNNNKNINKNLDSLKTDIEDAYKLYESGDIDLFEKRIEEIKIKYTNKKTKKEDKNKELKELQNSLIQKDKKITELLDEIKKLNENNNKNNETSIKNEIEKEYTKKFNDFKNNYQYDIENDEKYKKLLEEKKKLEENKSEINKEKNDNIKNLTEIINELKKSIEKLNNDNNKLLEEKKELENKLNKKSRVSKKGDHNNNNENTIEKDYGCYVYIFEDRINETRRKCSEKTQYDVKYYYDLYIKCKKEKTNDYDAFDDAAIYMLSARRTTINKQNREKWRNKFQKCKEIYELYGNDLDLVYFKISQMADIRDKKNWEEWKNYLGNKISEKKKLLENEGVESKDYKDEGISISEENTDNEEDKKFKEKVIKAMNLKYIDILKYKKIDYKKTSINELQIKDNKYNIKISIDKDLWCDNNNYKKDGNKEGGKGALNFYMYYYKINAYIDAINQLYEIYEYFYNQEKKENLNNTNNNNKNNISNEKKILNHENSNFLNNNNNEKNITENTKAEFIEDKNKIKKVREYLIDKRKLNSKIIDAMIQSGFITADKNDNVVFKNINGDFTYHRGIDSTFKKNNGNGYISYGNENSENVYIFESVIDILSYFELYNIDDIDKSGNFISTSGNMGINKNKFKKYINKYTKKIYLCFDNDEQGKKDIINSEKIIKEINKDIVINIIKPTLKDFNEDLIEDYNKKNTYIPVQAPGLDNLRKLGIID